MGYKNTDITIVSARLHNNVSVQAMTLLGNCFMKQKKLSEAERLLRHSLEIMKSAHTKDHRDVAHATCPLVAIPCRHETVWASMGQRARKSEIDQIKHDGRHLCQGGRRLGAQYTLANCLNLQGKVSESIKLMTDCVRMYKSSLHHEHPDVAMAVGQLGVYLLAVGNLDESEQYLRECLDIRRRSLQEKHPDTH
ncbi:uncharacterized protein LOC134188614 [Corticium candelabrum]|uniref:uncharacterized protein LOC134188614 n=1 Tax=Corticium candelabrum TaxID=121492 RepID=UPI002E271ED1|nr:uncharacterized protein LOC134188614 [Corticium candelabrum]